MKKSLFYTCAFAAFAGIMASCSSEDATQSNNTLPELSTKVYESAANTRMYIFDDNGKIDGSQDGITYRWDVDDKLYAWSEDYTNQHGGGGVTELFLQQPYDNNQSYAFFRANRANGGSQYVPGKKIHLYYTGATVTPEAIAEALKTRTWTLKRGNDDSKLLAFGADIYKHITNNPFVVREGYSEVDKDGVIKETVLKGWNSWLEFNIPKDVRDEFSEEQVVIKVSSKKGFPEEVTMPLVYGNTNRKAEVKTWGKALEVPFAGNRLSEILTYGNGRMFVVLPAATYENLTVELIIEENITNKPIKIYTATITKPLTISLTENMDKVFGFGTIGDKNWKTTILE